MLSFALREGFRNFLRNRTLSLAMAGSVAVAVFALGTVALTAININFLLKEWESRVELVAFLRHEAPEERAREILARIQALPQVQDARLVSGQESWLKLFSETGQPLDLGRVSLDEILPPTVVIKLKPDNNEIPQIKDLSAQISGFEGVDEVKFEQALLERYLQFRRQMAVVATAINIFWLLIFAIIMANISRLAWAARAGEIRSMHMMGASAGLMRKVFSIESLLQGTAGSLAGTAILYGVTFIIAQRLGRPVQAPAVAVAVVFTIGPILAVMASWNVLRKGMALAFLFVLSAALTSGVIRADELDSEVAKYRAELDRLRKELTQNRSAAERIAAQERSFSRELKTIEKEIAALDKDVNSARGKMITNQSAIYAGRAELVECEGRLKEARRELEHWLKALCLRRMPSVAEVVLLDIPHSDLTLRTRVINLLAQKEAEALTLTEGLRAQYSEQEENLRKRSELDNLYVETVNLKMQRLLEKKEEREDLLAGLRQQKDVYAAAINDLEASEKSLQFLLESARTKDEPRLLGSAPLGEMKGVLPWPVEGEVTSPYGRIENLDSGTYTRHLGLDITAPAGSEIRVVHDGVVAYCDWFRGYGKLVIVDHGNGYSSVYAHCSEILVKKDDFIGAGAPLALVGETGSLKGPFLYFEIREDGQPVDPQVWLQRRK